MLLRDEPIGSDDQHEAYWDGKDDSGESVSNGVYLYRITIRDWDNETVSYVGKCVLMR